MIKINVDIPLIDNAFGFVINIICKFFEALISLFFTNNVVSLVIFLLFVNWIAIILMKKDKQYAQTPGTRRVRESTLLIVAAVGGALGEYYAMQKYRHKTLHKKFTIGVPVMIMVHFAMLSFYAFYGIIA